jgi:hypothetical protein
LTVPHAFQRGQAIILVALMLGVVVGMAALAIDGSRAYALRRDMQNSVDYGALAAADNYRHSSSFSSAEAAGVTAFSVNMRLYLAPSCTGYGAPGPGTYAMTCTYPDGTLLAISVPVLGPRGVQFSLTATRTLTLQFARILTNGTSPSISATAGGRVGDLLYSPALAALSQAGCGGSSGTAISVGASGTLKVTGDVVSDGAISVSGGVGTVAGDVYARCQSTVSGLSVLCYPSGATPACTYPDVAGAFRTGLRDTDPGYPPPGPVGAGQASPGSTVLLLPGAYSAPVIVGSSRCYFLAGGVYSFQAGYSNSGSLVSNELKPPDEPTPGNNTVLASPQFWNATGAHCAGSMQYQAVQCTGNGSCGTGNCGQGVGQGNGCTAAPPGVWAIEVTSTRNDTYNGNTYTRESAPSTCQTVTVGGHQAIQVTVSNVPGAASYNIYAALPGTGCSGTFGLAETVPVSGPVLNSSLSLCPQFTGSSCSLGLENIVLNGNDIGLTFAPNAGAAPGTVGAYPPSSETAPLRLSRPNQNPPRLSGAAGDRANENSCETSAGAYATCPGAVTPGAVALNLPGSSCMSTSSSSDTYVFSGYQFNWVVFYEGAGNACANVLGGDRNTALIGLAYMPGASINFASDDTFDSPATGGVIAGTISFTGNLPAVTFSSAYAPVPFASRLVS